MADLTLADKLCAPATFVGYRPQPPAEYIEKGITNAGARPDYEGVVFLDRTVAVRWLTAYRSTSIWPDLETFKQVHGHPEYGTVIEFHKRHVPEVPIDGSLEIRQLSHLIRALTATAGFIEITPEGTYARQYAEAARAKLGMASRCIKEAK